MSLEEIIINGIIQLVLVIIVMVIIYIIGMMVIDLHFKNENRKLRKRWQIKLEEIKDIEKEITKFQEELRK